MENPEELCKELLQLDSSIRFVGIANHMGSLVATRFRRGLSPLLESEELQNYTMKAALRMKTREDYESNLGKIIYTFALYEKLKRASIPLNNSHLSLLMVSFDVNADHERIILDRMLPRVKQYKLITEAWQRLLSIMDTVKLSSDRALSHWCPLKIGKDAYVETWYNKAARSPTASKTFFAGKWCLLACLTWDKAKFPMSSVS